jgi:SNF2 family DNA or RNA helicase
MMDWLIEHERCSLWAGMGIGKTSGTLLAVEIMRVLGTIADAPTLVLGPMRVARDTWPDELAKWDNFKHLEIVPLVGGPAERARLLRLDRPYFTVSYENIPWLVEHFLERWPFRQVVADEADRLKGFREKSRGTGLSSKKAGSSGQRAHQIGRVAHTLVKRWINLAGTPAPNGLKDLWGQMWYVDRGARLGRTYGAFKDRWFRRKWSGHGIEPLPHAKDEIHALLRDICLTVDPKDYFDLKDPIVREIKVHLPPETRRVYKELEKELFATLFTGEDIEVTNSASLFNKCLQIANGAVYTTYPEWAPVHDEKIQALESIVSEWAGTPLLVTYEFKSDCARLKKAFPGAVELKTVAGMKAFKAGQSGMGLAHAGSLGHGIDGLQYVTNVIVRFGRNSNLGQQLQVLERVGPMRQLQAGLDRNVFLYEIITEDTVDEDIVASNLAKRDVQDCLLEAMKRRL